MLGILWETAGKPIDNLAKVGVEGSNPFARSSFLVKNDKLAPVNLVPGAQPECVSLPCRHQTGIPQPQRLFYLAQCRLGLGSIVEPGNWGRGVIGIGYWPARFDACDSIALV